MITDTTTPLSQKDTAPFAPRLLAFAATSWVTVTTVGQWIFACYILSFYGKSAFSGDFEKWNQVLPHGYEAGDLRGNLVVGVHILFAAILVIGGPLQLMPQIRKHFPRVHRWLGRTYVMAAIVAAAAGLFMVASRGGIGDKTQHMSISAQAVYIIVFAILAIWNARSRKFDSHRKWALRLFMVVSGVWFFRVWLMFWLLVNGRPAGFDPETFTGPFLTFLSLFTYAFPLSLMILELYFLAEKRRRNTWSMVTSVVILAFTAIMAVGIFGATMGMWLPRLK